MSQLTSEQRHAISVRYQSGHSQKSIAQVTGKDKSVISRELMRNRNPDNGKYTYSCAKELSELRKERLSIPRSFTGEVANRIDRS